MEVVSEHDCNGADRHGLYHRPVHPLALFSSDEESLYKYP
jgi:hypothetical protein